MSIHSYRVRNLLIASVLALAAIGMTLAYVSSTRSKQRKDAAPVSVLVAARDIPIGTPAAKLAAGGWTVSRSFPKDELPAQPVTSAPELAGLVAVQPTYRGEQLTLRRFGTTQRQGLLTDLKGTMRVAELPGDAHQLLAGTLQVGNRVDVVGSIRTPEESGPHYSRIVLRNLLVVAAAKAPTSSGISGHDDLSVQLQLTDEQEQRLFWLEKNGDWSLVLRPSTKARDTNVKPASAATLLGTANGR